MGKTYAIYDMNDMPVMAGNIKEAVDFLGITYGSFKSAISRIKSGRQKGIKQYTIYVFD